jgi:hypothetical protein
MENLDNKTNDEIMMILKNLEIEFTVQKQRLIEEYDKLDAIEKYYNNTAKILNNRLNGK